MKIWDFFKLAFTRMSKPNDEYGKVTADYFDVASEDVADYLLAKSYDCLNDIRHSIDKNTEKLNKLLNYLILGCGGAFMLLVTKYSALPSNIVAATYLIVLLWGSIGAYIIYFVIAGVPKLIVGNTPKAMYHETFKAYDWQSIGISERLALKQNELVRLSFAIENQWIVNRRLGIYFCCAAYLATLGTLLISSLVFLG